MEPPLRYAAVTIISSRREIPGGINASNPIVSIFLREHFNSVEELALLVDPPGIGRPAARSKAPPESMIFTHECRKEHEYNDEQDRPHDHPRAAWFIDAGSDFGLLGAGL